MIKNWLKKHFLILKVRGRLTPAVQLQQRNMYLDYRRMMEDGRLPSLSETGFRVFSQFEEDGQLLFLFSLIGMTHKTFVEIGADDGVNSNCANLAFHFGWHGLFVDGNPKAIERGRRFYARYPHPWGYKPKFRQAMIKRANINEIVSDAGMKGEIGLLSIDIDGNDYWVWDALEVVQPQVVIIETHNEFGMENIVVPYDPDYMYPGKHPVYHGASPVAMTKLAKQKGYRLVGANELGSNFIYVKEGLINEFVPEVSVESCLQHPSVKEGMKGFEEIRDWEYLRP